MHLATWSGWARGSQTHRRLEAQQLQQYGQRNGDAAALGSALRREEALIAEFEPLALDYLRLAQIRLALRVPGVAEALQRAAAASPHGVDTAAAIAQIEAQRRRAGVP